ncbi:MAG: acyltransferase, partial [Proteobacteria bacterium]|nr:acyltransferase [Pseudomonadota bacterium]
MTALSGVLMSQKYLGLEAARGVAASMVAVVHAIYITGEPRHYGVLPFGNFGINLAAGVDFFFVLSGFIIASTHLADTAHPERLGFYIKRRFLRIYPVYWAVLIPLVAIYSAVPSFGHAAQHDLGALLPSFTLLPVGNAMILGVAWTLQFEILFYFMFGLTIWRRAGWAALSVWFLATALALPFWSGWAYPWSFFLNPRILEFGAGVAAALYVARAQVPAPGLLLAAGIGGFLLSLATDHGAAATAALPYTYTFGISALLILLALVELERRGRVPQWRIFGLIGAASYAIYLVHTVAESAAERPFMLLRASLPPAASALCLALVGIAAGLVFHLIVERPVNGW